MKNINGGPRKQKPPPPQIHQAFKGKYPTWAPLLCLACPLLKSQTLGFFIYQPFSINLSNRNVYLCKYLLSHGANASFLLFTVQTRPTYCRFTAPDAEPPSVRHKLYHGFVLLCPSSTYSHLQPTWWYWLHISVVWITTLTKKEISVYCLQRQVKDSAQHDQKATHTQICSVKDSPHSLDVDGKEKGTGLNAT